MFNKELHFFQLTVSSLSQRGELTFWKKKKNQYFWFSYYWNSWSLGQVSWEGRDSVSLSISKKITCTRYPQRGCSSFQIQWPHISLFLSYLVWVPRIWHFQGAFFAPPSGKEPSVLLPVPFFAILNPASEQKISIVSGCPGSEGTQVKLQLTDMQSSAFYKGAVSDVESKPNCLLPENPQSVERTWYMLDCHCGIFPAHRYLKFSEIILVWIKLSVQRNTDTE